MLVHQACLFELPSPDVCDFQRWKKTANRTRNNKLEWMLNPRFREILPHAPALERIERLGLETVKQRESIPDKKVIEKMIKAKKQEITTVHRHYKHLQGKPEDARTQEQDADRTAQLSDLAAQRSRLRLELAELCAGMSLEEADMPILQAFYEKYQVSCSPAHKILVENGIAEKEIANFNSLIRCNNDIAIPNLMIDGANIGYPGLYLTKLDILSDKGAALAASLGKITDCCQYLGGTGSECAIHGITSPDGGFYVVCEGGLSKSKS
jgi:hypothetical protein